MTIQEWQETKEKLAKLTTKVEEEISSLQKPEGKSDKQLDSK